ncbi:MAG: hypothetical protein ACP5M0_05840 [Desulfomonilaceae bacterium]
MGALCDMGRMGIQQRLIQRMVRELLQQRLLASKLLQQRLHLSGCAGVIEQQQRIRLLVRPGVVKQQQRLCILLCARIIEQQQRLLLAGKLIEQRLLASKQLIQRLVPLRFRAHSYLKDVSYRGEAITLWDRLVHL